MENPRQSGSRDFESVLRPALADLQLSERRELLRKSCAFISSNAATFRLPARNYLIKLLEFPPFLPSFLRISSCLIRLFSSNGIEKGIKKIREYQITSNYISILFVDRARRREREILLDRRGTLQVATLSLQLRGRISKMLCKMQDSRISHANLLEYVSNRICIYISLFREIRSTNRFAVSRYRKRTGREFRIERNIRYNSIFQINRYIQQIIKFSYKIILSLKHSSLVLEKSRINKLLVRYLSPRKESKLGYSRKRGKGITKLYAAQRRCLIIGKGEWRGRRERKRRRDAIVQA